MEIKETAKRCLCDEAQAILDLVPRIDSDFEKAVELVYNCRGKFIVTGVGKSGHVGAKIAATLASLGTPSFFVNPLDAYHGDLGMFEPADIVLAISYSGNTDELLRFIPLLRERNIPIISMTGHPDSLLARYSVCHLNISVEHEADPLNLAPTASTTATIAMGDALASALACKRDFRAADFAKFHPGGALGRKLLHTAGQVCRTEDLPTVPSGTPLSDIIITISDGKLGLVVITDDERHILGLITDYDLRHAITRYGKDFFDVPVDDIMTLHPLSLPADAPLTCADELFSHHHCHSLLVTDDDNCLYGVLESFKCI